MKLVDILALELKEWPEKWPYIAQDGRHLDCQVSFYDEKPTFSYEEWGVETNPDFAYCYPEQDFDLAEDYATAIVTRAQWEAAVEALRNPLPPLKNPLPMPNVVPPKQEAIDWPEWATHMLTTGPNWDGDQGVIGSIEFAALRGYSYHHQWDGEFCMGDSSWVVLGERHSVAWNGEGLPPVGTVCELRCKTGGWGEAEIKYQGRAICVWLWIRHDGNADQVEWAENPERMEFRPIRTPEQIAAEERQAEIAAMVEIISDAHGDRNIAIALHDAGYRKQVQP